MPADLGGVIYVSMGKKNLAPVTKDLIRFLREGG
jgi:hypothetical protein